MVDGKKRMNFISQYILGDDDAELLVGEPQLPQREELYNGEVFRIARPGDEFQRRRPILLGAVVLVVGLFGPGVEEAVDLRQLVQRRLGPQSLNHCPPGHDLGGGARVHADVATLHSLFFVLDLVQDSRPLGQGGKVVGRDLHRAQEGRGPWRPAALTPLGKGVSRRGQRGRGDDHEQQQKRVSHAHRSVRARSLALRIGLRR